MKALSGDQKAFFQYVLDINAVPETTPGSENLDYVAVTDRINSNKKLFEECIARDSKVVSVYKEMSLQTSLAKFSINQAILFIDKFKELLLKHQEKLVLDMVQIDKSNKSEELKAVRNEVDNMNKKKNELDKQLLELHQQIEKNEILHSELLYSITVNSELKKEMDIEVETSVKQHEIIGNMRELLKVESVSENVGIYKECSITTKGFNASSKEFFKLFNTLLSQYTTWWNLVIKFSNTEIEKYKRDKIEISKGLEKLNDALKQWEAERSVEELKDFNEVLNTMVTTLSALIQQVSQRK